MEPTGVCAHGNGDEVRREPLASRWDRVLFGTDMGRASRMAY